MSRVLTVSRIGRVAGAEKIALNLKASLAKRFDFSLALLDRRHEDFEREFGSPALGWAAIFFGRYPIIHSHLFHAGLAVRIRRLWDSSFTWVHTVHYDTYEGQNFRALKKWLDRKFIFPAADKLISVSEVVKASLAEFPNHVFVSNGIELKEGEPRKIPGDSFPVIGVASMLRAEKNLTVLLRALAHLRTDWPQARLRIAGTGPQRSELEALAAELGISRSVEFCGHLQDMRGFYASLDIYAQPSQLESFCLAAHEALQFSLPLVVSNAGNLPHIAGQGRFGLIVDRGSADFAGDLARALAEAASHHGLWRERAAQGFLALKYKASLERMAQGYADVYAPGSSRFESFGDLG